jgi:hypothetical protein
MSLIEAGLPATTLITSLIASSVLTEGNETTVSCIRVCSYVWYFFERKRTCQYVYQGV